MDAIHLTHTHHNSKQFQNIHYKYLKLVWGIFMARKKQAVSQKPKTKSKFDDLFKSCPFTTYSKFERENFAGTTGVGYARHVISTVNRIRKLESDLESETRTFERNCINEEITQLYAYLEEQDFTTLKNAVDSWEAIEKEYWINTLGKQAAIELITLGRTSPETMSKMVRLPEDMYTKVTQICVRLANTIKETTIKAEAEIGVKNADSVADETPTPPTVPKKINLKKIQ